MGCLNGKNASKRWLRASHFSRMLFPSKRHVVITAILSTIFSLMLICGYSLHRFGRCFYGDSAFILAIALVAIVLYISLSGLWLMLDTVSTLQSQRNIRLLRIAAELPFRYWALADVVVVSASWVGVGYLASFPGYYCYDSYHLTQVATDGDVLTDYQSVWHSLCAGYIIKLGMSLFGSYNGGVALFIFVQITVCVAFSLLILWTLIEVIGCSKVVAGCCIAFYAINPLVIMFVCCSTKDTMFTVAMLTFGILICIEAMGVERTTRQRCIVGIGITLSCFLSLSYRNNALYALIVFLVLAFIVLKPWRLGNGWIISFAAPLCAAFIMYGIWVGPVAKLLEVEHSNPLREMISVPANQLARMASYNELEDAAEFERLGVSASSLATSYALTPHNSDVTRPLFYGALESERGELARLWIENVRAHPFVALDAFLALTEGTWSPFARIDGYNSWNPQKGYLDTDTSLFECVQDSPAFSESFLPAVNDYFYKLSRFDVSKEYPVASFLTWLPPFIWLLLLALGRSVIKRNRIGILLGSLIFINCLIMMLGPVVLPRYYLPAIFGAPLLLAVLFQRQSIPSPISTLKE